MKPSPHNAHRGPAVGTQRPRWGFVDLEELAEDELWDLFLDDVRHEADGGRAVTLRHYLECVPGIQKHPHALHAAITAVIEGAVALGRSRMEVFQELTDSHPDLATAIDEVRLVDELMGSTESLSARLLGDQIDLPTDFGPEWRRGERRYQLLEQISRGSTGAVYLAKDRSLSDATQPAMVAIKLVPDWLHVDREELLREGVRARRVLHPNVARVFEAGYDPQEGLYLVFEYIIGVTLDEHRAGRSLPAPPRVSVSMMMPLLRGLAAAHARGVAHMDIHPRNILIRQTGEPVLIDFGLGMAVSDMGGPLRRAVGALGFVAPEVFRGDSDIDPMLADVYSIAGLLWWLLTGSIPNGSSAEQIEARLVSEAPDLPQARWPTGGDALDEDLRFALRRGLAFTAHRRTPSVAALVRDLTAWLEHRPIEGTRPSSLKRARLYARRSPHVIASALTLVAVSGLASGALTWQRVTHRHRERVSAANAAAREAELGRSAAEARADAAETEARRAADTRRAMNGLNVIVASSGREGVTQDWAIALVLLRDLYDDGDAMSADALDRIRDARIEHARTTIKSLLKTHGHTDAVVLLWRAMLGSSLADAGRFADAAEELALCAGPLEARFGESEPMIQRLRVLHVCCKLLSERDPAERVRLSQLLSEVDAPSLPQRLRELVVRARESAIALQQ